MKLIEIIKDSHYIVIDDSDIHIIEKGSKVYVDELIGTAVGIYNNNMCEVDFGYTKTEFKNKCKKITHSTQPLKGDDRFNDSLSMFNGETLENVKFLEKELSIYPYKLISLSEVKESICGYSLEKRVKEALTEFSKKSTDFFEGFLEGHEKGFNFHKELVKDKLFSVDDMMLMFERGMYYMGNKPIHEVVIWDDKAKERAKYNIQTILQKTEWDVEFDQQGKIKLL